MVTHRLRDLAMVIGQVDSVKTIVVGLMTLKLKPRSVS